MFWLVLHSGGRPWRGRPAPSGLQSSAWFDIGTTAAPCCASPDACRTLWPYLKQGGRSVFSQLHNLTYDLFINMYTYSQPDITFSHTELHYVLINLLTVAWSKKHEHFRKTWLGRKHVGAEISANGMKSVLYSSLKCSCLLHHVTGLVTVLPF